MGLIQNEDIKSEAELISFGGTKAQLPNDSKVYVSASGINKTLKEAIEDGEIGGGGGGVDFLSGYKITEFSTYKDAAASVPVDGTGGTAVYTTITALSGGSLIDSTKGLVNFRISKASGGNAQGEGISIPFVTRGAVDRATWLDVKLAHKDSVNYNDGKLVIFLYDVTNSRIIYPVDQDLYVSGLVRSDTFKFMTSADSDSYRLIFHVADTNTTLAWDVDCTLSVAPQMGKVQGAFVGDIEDASTKYTVANFTTSSFVAKEKRIGDEVFVDMSFVMAANPTSDMAIFLNHPIDYGNNKLVGIGSGSEAWQRVGTISCYSSGEHLGVACVYGADNKIVFFGDDGSAYWNGANPISSWASVVVRVRINYPVKGWSSNVDLSTSYSNRPLIAEIYQSGSNLIAVGTNKIPLTLVKSDTAGMTDTANSRIYIKESGWYDTYLKTDMSVAAGGAGGWYVPILRKNGADLRYYGFKVISAGGYDVMGNPDTSYFQKGDYLEFFLAVNNVAVTCADSRMTVKKANQGSQTIAFPEKVFAEYVSDAGQSIPSITTTTVLFEDKLSDSHSSYNTASGEISIYKTGTIVLDASVMFAGTTTWAPVEYAYLTIKNLGTGRIRCIDREDQFDSANTYMYLSGTVSFGVTKGETFRIEIYQNSGSSLGLHPDTSYNKLSFTIE